MRVEFDRFTCTGMFQCIHEWDAFTQDLDAGKAVLEGAERAEDDVWVLEVPEGEEFEAEMAARVCPVDAISVYDDGGERLV